MLEIAAVAAVGVTGLFGIWMLGRGWGVQRIESWAGEGGAPYRMGVVHGERTYGAPALVVGAVALNVSWGVATAGIFAPAGILFTMMSGWIAPVMALLVLSGFGLGVGLIYASWRVLRRGRTASDHAESIAMWSVLHHVGIGVAVPLACVLGEFAKDGAGDLLQIGLILGVVPATAGVLLALLLRAAVGRVRRADAEEADLLVARVSRAV